VNRISRSRYQLPVFCAVLGLVMAGALVLGDQDGTAIFTVVLFGAITLALLLGGRSETIRVVRGDLSDERWRQHDVRATSFTGIVLIFVVLGAWIVSVARGHDGQPYSALGAVAGVTYLVAVIALRLRA
jgi:hypothetical protein